MTKRNEKKKFLFCNRVKLRARTAAEHCRVARADAEIRRYYVVAAPLLFCFFYKNFYFLAQRAFIMTYRLGGGGTYI
jgi:hypothetical protein